MCPLQRYRLTTDSLIWDNEPFYSGGSIIWKLQKGRNGRHSKRVHSFGGGIELVLVDTAHTLYKGPVKADQLTSWPLGGTCEILPA